MRPMAQLASTASVKLLDQLQVVNMAACERDDLGNHLHPKLQPSGDELENL